MAQQTSPLAGVAETRFLDVSLPGLPAPLRIALHSATANTPGRQNVVFVHGNSSSGKIWAGQLAALPSLGFNAHAVDLPGHGESADAPKPHSESVYTLDGFSETVAAALEAAGLHNPDTLLIGWSLGGHISIRCIPRLPKLAAFGAHGTPPFGFPIDMAAGFEMGDPSMPILFKPEPYTLDEAKLRVEGMLAPDCNTYPEFMVNDVLRRDPEFSRVLPTSIGTSDVSELDILGSTAKPFLLGHGSAERVIKGSYLHDIVRDGKVPTAWKGHVVEWAKAGHTPQIEDEEKYTEDIVDFAKEVFGK